MSYTRRNILGQAIRLASLAAAANAGLLPQGASASGLYGSFSAYNDDFVRNLARDLASKPYVASGAYVNRMSDHCGGCFYRVDQRTGPRACPFNPLYWLFLETHRGRFGRHPRMAVI